jgi:hypothetical protein
VLRRVRDWEVERPTPLDVGGEFGRKETRLLE